MLFGHIDHLNQDALLLKGVKKALDFARANDLASFETGSHPIDGDDLFVNIVEYTTTAPENRFWEAHREYLDVHVPLKGSEQIDMGFLCNMEELPYQPESDFTGAHGEKTASVILQPGTFLVCAPQDAHRTAVAVNGRPEPVKKAIFKVRIGA